MAIRKSLRRRPEIDMTPMVDLGFLLVTFFMMTTQFAPTELVQVVIPHSTSNIELPESNVTTILISKEGAVFFRMDGKRNMRFLGEKLNGKYTLGLTEDELDKFSRMSGLGIPLGNLKQFLELPEAEQKNMTQQGIPIEAQQNELTDWLIYSRITNQKSRLVFKADKETPYPVIKKVMDTLQACNIDRFSLITDTERK